MSLIDELNTAIADEKQDAIRQEQEVAKESFVFDMLRSKSVGVASKGNTFMPVALSGIAAVGLYFLLKK